MGCITYLCVCPPLRQGTIKVDRDGITLRSVVVAEHLNITIYVFNCRRNMGEGNSSALLPLDRYAGTVSSFLVVHSVDSIVSLKCRADDCKRCSEFCSGR